MGNNVARIDSPDIFVNSLQGSSTLDLLINNNFDTGVIRSWVGKDGRSYCNRTINGETRVMVTNTPATLSYDGWKLFDDTIIEGLRDSLTLVNAIRSRVADYTLPNGMAHTILQYQTRSRIRGATISMDPVRRSEADRPLTDIAYLPLPIIHQDFDFTAREVLASRQGTMPLDTDTAEQATISIAELLENLTAGTAGTFSYGGGTIYGLTNFPSRVIKTDLTAPTGSNNDDVLADVLAMRQSLIDDKHLGPFVLFVNKQWSEFLDTDFKANGDKTLRQRILDLGDIEDIVTVDSLPSTQYRMVLVEMKARTIRMVVGMEAQTVQWESAGGYMKHWKVMMLQVPQLRADTDGNSGIADARTAA